MSVIDLTDATFEQTVLKADKPVLVDFWAAWCSPCQLQGPIVEEVAKELSGSVVVGKLNVDENPVASQSYGIMSIPTLMVFHKGKAVKQFIGVQQKETLIGELKKHI